MTSGDSSRSAIQVIRAAPHSRGAFPVIRQPLNMRSPQSRPVARQIRLHRAVPERVRLPASDDAPRDIEPLCGGPGVSRPGEARLLRDPRQSPVLWVESRHRLQHLPFPLRQPLKNPLHMRLRLACCTLPAPCHLPGCDDIAIAGVPGPLAGQLETGTAPRRLAPQSPAAPPAP